MIQVMFVGVLVALGVALVATLFYTWLKGDE